MVGVLVYSMATKVTMGELQEYADQEDIDYDDDISYEEMREIIDIHECKQCGDEFLRGWDEKYCSDACEAAYINEHF